MQVHKLIQLLVILGSILSADPSWAKDEKGEQCTIATTAISDASRIRKLQIKKSVPCLVHQKEQVKGYLLHAVDTKIPAVKLQMEAFVYQTVGIIPENFDYQNGIIELYLNQIGGYYDPEKKHFVMAGWLPAMLQTTIAVHELTHALQDQYFNLETFMDEKRFNGDELLARSALVEGDATAVMIDYTRRTLGQPGIENDENVASMMMQNVVGSSLVSSLQTVPQSMQNLLIFPYTSGLRFTHFALRKGSYEAVNEIFRRPPRSTEEILHPEKYFVAAPDFERIPGASLKPAQAPSAELKYEDVLGEFTISTMLANFTADKPAAAAAAAGWGGDTAAVFDDAANNRRFLVWQTNWDTAKDAEEFSRLYKQALKQRFPQFDLTTGQGQLNDRSISLATDDKKITLTVESRSK